MYKLYTFIQGNSESQLHVLKKARDFYQDLGSYIRNTSSFFVENKRIN